MAPTHIAELHPALDAVGVSRVGSYVTTYMPIRPDLLRRLVGYYWIPGPKKFIRYAICLE